MPSIGIENLTTLFFILFRQTYVDGQRGTMFSIFVVNEVAYLLHDYVVVSPGISSYRQGQLSLFKFWRSEIRWRSPFVILQD